MSLKKVWLSSDTHFGHVRALEIMPNRPWTTLDNMNQGMLDNFNEVVAPDDFLIFVGDVVMGKKWENVPNFMRRLHGQKILIRGNHDGGFGETGEKQAKWNQLYLDNGFVQVLDGLVSLNALVKQLIGEDLPYDMDVCHFPYAGTPDHDGYDARYYHLMPPVSDRLLVHGHTHQPFQVTSDKMLHVGVDAWDWKPVSLIDLLSVAELNCKVN